LSLEDDLDTTDFETSGFDLDASAPDMEEEKADPLPRDDTVHRITAEMADLENEIEKLKSRLEKLLPKEKKEIKPRAKRPEALHAGAETLEAEPPNIEPSVEEGAPFIDETPESETAPVDESARDETPVTGVTGFDTDVDTDEAIALSDDEIENILASSDFTREEPEPFDSFAGIGQEEKQAEKTEPADIDIDSFGDLSLPEEIDIPKVDEVPEEPVLDIQVEEETLTPDLKEQVKSVLVYMDQLLENLPEEKIKEFTRSEQYAIYKNLFEELGIS
jgi:hypothetical protein